MKTHKKLAILISVIAALGIIGTAIAGYTTYTPITNVSITSHNDGDIVFANHDYTVTCTTSTDKDCDDETYEIVNDPVVHTWSGPGTFDPTTGTSVTWTTPNSVGDATIWVTASDNSYPYYANDTDKQDSVTLTVQNIIYVDEDATGNNNGTSWADAFNDLQDALDAAASGNEIWVAEGTYKPSKKTDPNNSRTATFQLVSGVEVYGGFDPTIGDDTWAERGWPSNKIILSGDIGTPNSVSDNCYHVVRGEDNAILDGFTITKGNANWGVPDDRGGGMLSRNCTSPTVRNCFFVDNCAMWGGGLCNADYYLSESATTDNCVFYDNSAVYFGGGLCILGVDAAVTNCVFTGNTSYYGAGVSCFACHPNLTNNTFTDNSGGAALHINGSGQKSTIVTLTNCILWADDGDYEILGLLDPNLIISYTDVEGGWDGPKVYVDGEITNGGGNIDKDPNFVDPNDPDGNDDKWMTSDDGLAIDDTRAIDAADGNIAPSTDILGNSRYDDLNWSNIGIGDPNYVDMGAYEYQGS